MGLDIDLTAMGDAPQLSLFNEGCGAVIQIEQGKRQQVMAILQGFALADCTYSVAQPNQSDELLISHAGNVLYREQRATLHRYWSSTSYHMQRVRDNPTCADQEYAQLLDNSARGLYADIQFPYDKTTCPAPAVVGGHRPRVAILREQGVNGHVEMAAAFDQAGFAAVDVHMSDLVANRVTLDNFVGLAACGGFSYGDVLGAGQGWAKIDSLSPAYGGYVQDIFSAFGYIYTRGV